MVLHLIATVLPQMQLPETNCKCTFLWV